MRFNSDKNLLLSTVGFERLFDAFYNLDSNDFENKNHSYPPYDIVKRSENSYLLEVAVAGFQQHEIDITSEDKKLKIEGRKNYDKYGVKRDKQGYLHQGIARRDFVHKFVVADHVAVGKANIADGILTIELTNITPEEKKPRKIKINSLEN